MMELYLVRHGETDENQKGKYLGRTDVPLNQNGRLQAERLKNKLPEMNMVFASPMQRTVETARILCPPQQKIWFMDGLKERDFGIFDNMTYRKIQSSYPKECAQWDQDWLYYKIPEGESALQAYQRNAAAMDRILAQPQQKIMVVSHLGAIRNLICYLLGIGVEQVWHFRVENGQAVKLAGEKGFWYLHWEK